MYLDSTRIMGMMAPNPISIAEINAALYLYNVVEKSQQLRIAGRIRAMDHCTLKWFMKRSKK